jgi:hypothetical protein
VASGSQLADRTPGQEGFGDKTVTGLQTTAAAIDFGQAISHGDAMDIAGSGINLALNLDNWVYANSGTEVDLLSNGVTDILRVGASGLNFADALQNGDGWDMAYTGLQFAESANNAWGTKGEGAVGAGLDLAVSAAGLAMNIVHMDDLFEYGNGLEITYGLAATVNNAINTYNAAMQLSGNAGSMIGGAGSVPYLAYAAAAIQLVQGEVVGAAVTAGTAALAGYVSTLACFGPYGWVAAAVVVVVGSLLGGLLGDDDPPSASAGFHVDADGHITMSVGGDSEMRGTAEAYGNPMLTVMQNYSDSGGRILIPGESGLPRLVVTAGEASQIVYGGDGGNIALGFTDPADGARLMGNVLMARDRSGRVDEAIHMATNALGEVDMDKAAAVLAGYGFVRNGINFTYGEDNSERQGHAVGMGIFAGGGNVGGQGDVILAEGKNFKSIPLKPEQLFSQQLAEIRGSTDLGQTFTGAGAGLLIAAMLAEGKVVLAGQESSPIADGYPTVCVMPIPLSCRRSRLLSHRWRA